MDTNTGHGGPILVVVVGYGLFTSVLLYPLFAQRIVGMTATQTGQLLIPGGLVTLPMLRIKVASRRLFCESRAILSA